LGIYILTQLVKNISIDQTLVVSFSLMERLVLDQQQGDTPKQLSKKNVTLTH
jgi:hypothetical protein